MSLSPFVRIRFPLTSNQTDFTDYCFAKRFFCGIDCDLNIIRFVSSFTRLSSTSFYPAPKSYFRKEYIMPKRYLLMTSLLLASFFPIEARGLDLNNVYPPTGFVTDRLSDGELGKWKVIEQIVFAEGNEQQALHPTLRNLWQWIETSGHTVYIEIIRTREVSSCIAGLFLIERFDPLGEHHIAVIRLNLENINQAYVGAETSKANGFIPFLGLEKERRYAEVLGHELAHAIHILTDLERVRLVEDVIQQTNQMLLASRRRYKVGGLAVELKRRLFRRDVLLKSLEEQAEEMEKVVWQELIAKPLSALRQAGRK